MALFGDWRDIRSAIEAAYSEIGKTAGKDGIDRADWDLVDKSIKAYRRLAERTCVNCDKPITFQCEIVCLDCSGPLHKECAPRHFWPNGRPKGSVHQSGCKHV